MQISYTGIETLPAKKDQNFSRPTLEGIWTTEPQFSSARYKPEKP